MVYLLVSISVAAMTAAHLFLKKGMLIIGRAPQNPGELVPFYLKAFTNIHVISGIFLIILTGLAWILAVSRAELSSIYPFMALSFVLVALFSLLLFKEDVTILRWLGIIIICLGVFLVSRN